MPGRGATSQRGWHSNRLAMVIHRSKYAQSQLFLSITELSGLLGRDKPALAFIIDYLQGLHHIVGGPYVMQAKKDGSFDNVEVHLQRTEGEQLCPITPHLR